MSFSSKNQPRPRRLTQVNVHLDLHLDDDRQAAGSGESFAAFDLRLTKQLYPDLFASSSSSTLVRFETCCGDKALHARHLAQRRLDEEEEDDDQPGAARPPAFSASAGGSGSGGARSPSPPREVKQLPPRSERRQLPSTAPPSPLPKQPAYAAAAGAALDAAAASSKKRKRNSLGIGMRGSGGKAPKRQKKAAAPGPVADSRYEVVLIVRNCVGKLGCDDKDLEFDVNCTTSRQRKREWFLIYWAGGPNNGADCLLCNMTWEEAPIKREELLEDDGGPMPSLDHFLNDRFNSAPLSPHLSVYDKDHNPVRTIILEGAEMTAFYAACSSGQTTFPVRLKPTDAKSTQISLQVNLDNTFMLNDGGYAKWALGVTDESLARAKALRFPAAPALAPAPAAGAAAPAAAAQ